jgi:hypothetical protein
VRSWLTADALALTIDALTAIDREQPPPDVAEAMFRQVQVGLGGGLTAELIAREEPHDGSHRAHAILYGPEGTLSVTVAQGDGLPWPLRGAVHADQLVAVTTAGEATRRFTRLRDAMAETEPWWGDDEARRRLIDRCLLRRICALEPPVVPPEAVERHADELVARRGLSAPAAQTAFEALYALPPGAIRRFAAEEAALEAVAERAVGHCIEDHFARSPAAYDRFLLARLALRDAARAEEVAAELRAGLLDLGRAVERESVDPAMTMMVDRLLRRDLAGQAAAPLEQGEPGAVLVAGRELLVLLAMEPAVLDAEVAEVVRRELFEGWLAGRRAAVVVRWNWGPRR